MKRATITIGDELEKALRAYLRKQEIPPALTSVVQAALREYLGRRGYAAPASPLRITPARRGGGRKNVSIRHDEYLARQ